MKGNQITVPMVMRSEMLDTVNMLHLGVAKCKQLIRDVLFWPGTSKQIEDKVTSMSVIS